MDVLGAKGLELLLKGERFERNFEVSLSSSEIDLEGFLVGPFLQMASRENDALMGWARNDVRDIVDTSTHAFGVDGRVGGEGVGLSTVRREVRKEL
jgi:hypothetical protein